MPAIPAQQRYMYLSPEISAVVAPAIIGSVIGDRRKKNRAGGIHGGLVGGGIGAGGLAGYEAAEQIGADDYGTASLLAILSGMGLGGYGGHRLSVLAGLADEEESKKEKTAEASPTLQKLIQAKYLSDKNQYLRKNQILRELMHAAPKEFVISDDEKHGIIGVTHVPTNFKIHTLVRNTPQEILQNKATTSEKTSSYSKLLSLVGTV
jgi:hypothetical protein